MVNSLKIVSSNSQKNKRKFFFTNFLFSKKKIAIFLKNASFFLVGKSTLSHLDTGFSVWDSVFFLSVFYSSDNFFPSSSSRRGENIVPMIASGKQSSEVSTFVTLGYTLDRGAKFGNKTIGSKTIFFHAAGRQESIPGSELSDAAAAMEQSRDNLEEATGTMPETSEPGDSPASDEDAINLEGSEEQFTENPQAPAAAAPVTETEKASFSSASDTLNTTSGTARDWKVFSNGVRDFKNWDEDRDAR
jgi:hypothetical protein